MFVEITCGCFYWAWMVYCDMQIYLFVPIYAILFMKSRKFAIFLQVFLWIFTAILIIFLTEKYDLKSGPLSAEGYYMFANLTNKPWGKFGSQAWGVFLAYFYYDLLKYRALKTDDERAA